MSQQQQNPTIYNTNYPKHRNMQLSSLPADLGFDMKMVIQHLSYQFEVMWVVVERQQT